MRRFSKLILTFVLFSPVFVQAYSCSQDGHTVIYINGIFTSEDKAAREAKALWANLGNTYEGEIVTVKTAYNPTHLAGLTDGIEAFSQILGKPISTFDRNTILNQIHGQLDTRKVVLVGHSQGALYANEIYNYLINHGEPIEAVGEYLVAAPTNGVANKNGGYINSSTDSLLSNLRGLGFTLLPNTVDLPISPKDKGANWPGHSLLNQYLEEAPDQIVSDIQRQLSSLRPVLSTTQGDCFTPPDSTLATRAQQVFFAVGDPVAEKIKIGTRYEEMALRTLSNWGIAAVATAFDVTKQVVSDAGVYLNGAYALSQAADEKYHETNFNIEEKIYRNGAQTVDGENLYDLLHNSPTQGGAVVLATVQDTHESAPTPEVTGEPTTPTVPIGPAPGFSPGGGGGGSSGAVNSATAQTTAASVPDTTAPVINGMPTDFSIQAASHSATDAVGTYTTPTAIDDVDGSVSVSCSPVSGSTFVVGTTTVTCSATDAAGNTASTTFNIGVYVPAPPPAAAPVVINEVAWGGGFGSPDDQWVELYNNGSDNVSLGDIVLTSADGALYMPLSGTIAGNGFYILLANDEAIRNIKNNWSNYLASASLVLGSSPKQLQLVRVGPGGTTTLDQTPAADACGGAWCAGSASATDGYAAPTGNSFPITMERVSAGSSGDSSGNWASSDGYTYNANDRNQQRIIGTPNYANTSHWPMVGFICTGDSSALTPGSTHARRPAGNNCHYLYGYSSYNWSVEALLLKGTIGSSTIVTKLSASNGPYKDLQTDASHTYDFASAQSGDTYTVVFFEFSNNVGSQFNAYYISDMESYVQSGFQRDGTTALAPYSYQTITFVIP